MTWQLTTLPDCLQTNEAAVGGDLDIFAAALTRAIREYLCFSSSCLFSRRAVSSAVSVHSAHGCCWHTGESSAWTRLRIINCHFRPSAEVRTCRFSATAAAPRTAKDKDFCWRLAAAQRETLAASLAPWRSKLGNKEAGGRGRGGRRHPLLFLDWCVFWSGGGDTSVTSTMKSQVMIISTAAADK